MLFKIRFFCFVILLGEVFLNFGYFWILESFAKHFCCEKFSVAMFTKAYALGKDQIMSSKKLVFFISSFSVNMTAYTNQIS